MTIDFVPLSEGTCLILTHEMDPAWAAYEKPTRKGWTMILANLATALEKDDD